MAATPKVLARTTLSATNTTVLYTVPASTTTVVTNIVLCNTAATSVTVTMYLGGVGFLWAAPLAGNTTTVIDCKQVLTTTLTIQGGCSSAGNIHFHISGVEIV